MTLLEQLQSRRGGLVLLKTQLFWYDGRGHDNNPGRICLLLDAARSLADSPPLAALVACTAAGPAAAVLLLIEGQPQRIWVAEQDVELVDED